MTIANYSPEVSERSASHMNATMWPLARPGIRVAVTGGIECAAEKKSQHFLEIGVTPDKFMW